MTNGELESMLPDIHNVLHKMMSSKDFTDYEDKLDKATSKAITALEGIIDDGSLALDPEQMVAAVKTLTKAKTDIIESKRRLFDTCIKGEVMIKALEKPKDDKTPSALLDYLQKNNLDTSLDKTGTTPTSIFESIADENVQTDND